jgi:Tol biopolymer transport system component
LTRLTFNAGLTTSPALSADGKLLAYASDRASEGKHLDIWVQHMAGGEPVRLTKDEGSETEPDISPDGSHVAFTSSRGGIYVVPLLGGELRQITQLGSRPRYSPDGKWIAFHQKTRGAGEGSRTFVIPATGGAPRQLLASFKFAAFPTWSSDGTKLLVVARVREVPNDWWLVPLDDGEPRPLSIAPLMLEAKIPEFETEPSFWKEGRAVFTARFSGRSQILSLRMDAATGKPGGKIESVTLGTAQDQDPTMGADGRIAFASTQFSSELWQLPVDTNKGKVTGPLERLTNDAALNDTVSITADGTRISFLSNRDGVRGMWLRDMTSARYRKLSPSTGKVIDGPTFPGMSHDGRFISYEFVESNQVKKNMVANLVDGTVRTVPHKGFGMSPSGRYLFHFGKTSEDPLQVSLSDSEESHEFMAQSKWPQRSPVLSPDERWLVLHTVNSPATRQIWIMPFQFGKPAAEADWIPITDGATLDRNAQWSPDGNMLYWIADRRGVRGIWAVRLDPATKRPKGEGFEIKMFPDVRQSMMPFSSTAPIQPAVAKDKIVFALGEESGNIWMTKLPQ